MSVNPKQPLPREGQYVNEMAAFGDLTSIFKHFMGRSIRPSRTSPPIANDVDELTLVYDKTQQRLYTKVNGSLRYVAFT